MDRSEHCGAGLLETLLVLLLVNKTSTKRGKKRRRKIVLAITFIYVGYQSIDAYPYSVRVLRSSGRIPVACAERCSLTFPPGVVEEMDGTLRS